MRLGYGAGFMLLAGLVAACDSSSVDDTLYLSALRNDEVWTAEPSMSFDNNGPDTFFLDGCATERSGNCAPYQTCSVTFSIEIRAAFTGIGAYPVFWSFYIYHDGDEPLLRYGLEPIESYFEVTVYDEGSEMVTGEFEVVLLNENDTSDTLRITDGRFRARLQP